MHHSASNGSSSLSPPPSLPSVRPHLANTPLRAEAHLPGRQTMNRGPVVLTIDEAEYLLDQMPPPEEGEDELVRQLRQKLALLLKELRKGAEGVGLAGGQ
ncbi:MAG: hypothetical protein BJ554DRAFT_5422 [Olpidium bornovanus]|uniref:Uncharacterized protein n=1 Tax=Olpidium bornovanus TaxID=278681 RepID=A0A8H8DMU3_9FUNG|nr:MAG: hypothetical protein BJ554DRAFT_5422 [Olpidium bornovanus]